MSEELPIPTGLRFFVKYNLPPPAASVEALAAFREAGIATVWGRLVMEAAPAPREESQESGVGEIFQMLAFEPAKNSVSASWRRCGRGGGWRGEGADDDVFAELREVVARGK